MSSCPAFLVGDWQNKMQYLCSSGEGKVRKLWKERGEESTLNAREREGNLGRQALKVKQCDNP